MKHLNEKGFTLVEIMISLLLLGALGIATFNALNFSKRATDIRSEDIQALLSQFGASKLISRDLDNSLPSFNFISTRDDNDRPFFVWGTNELCLENCSRSLTITIDSGLTSSRVFYSIVRKGMPQELEKFLVDPLQLYAGTTNPTFEGINRYYNHPAAANYSISQRYRTYSPWIKDRILLLTTLNSFPDCNNLIDGASASTSCNTFCDTPGCNFAALRPIKFLGYVDNNERDLIPFSNISTLPLNRHYRFCQQSLGKECTNAPTSPLVINTSESLLGQMPYLPGKDNRAFLTPVEIIRYSLKRNSTQDLPSKFKLIREKAYLSSGTLTWGSPIVMLTGIKSLTLKRPSISSPVIEYDLNLVSNRKL